MCNYDQKEKILFFLLIFFNMDISLTVPLKCLRFAIHVGETQMEGSVSQNFD